MTDKERHNLLTYMEEFKKKVAGNKELARDFLIRSGIYTKNGRLAEPYKHLHFPSIESN
jgi:hypothetical protein